MIDNIVLFNSLNYATFPVNSNTKAPAVRDWKNRAPDILAAYSEEDLYTRAGAYGVILGPGDLVLDLDPRNFKDNINPWKKLREDLSLGEILVPAVKTGGGGYHLYFKKPEDLNVLTKLDAYPGLDFKAGGLNKGVYVIGPGSKHPSGALYAFREGPGLDLAVMAPQALLDAVARRKSALNEGTGAFTGGVQELNRYKAWLKKAVPAVEGASGDATTFKAAVKGRDFGLTEADTYAALLEVYNPRCTPPWSPEALVEKVKNAYRYAAGGVGILDPITAFSKTDVAEVWDETGHDKWDVDKGGKVTRTMRNAVNFIYQALADNIKFNQFTGDLEVTGKLPWNDKRGMSTSWTDRDVVLLKYHLHRETRVEFNVDTLWEALYTAGTRHAYHPIREYITSLKWDGTPRLDKWLQEYCGAHDNEYITAVGRKTLVAAIARIFDPGHKFDYCLILEGDQGIGKSTVCSIFGGEWYGDIILDPHSRDTVDAMRGKWFIELSEMEVTRRSDVQALKAFVSRTSDRTRLAYARAAQDFPRQCVFIGTINPDGMGYLSDTTGNRRFWPVKCGAKINMTGLKEVRDQIFAEAYLAYKKGEILYLTGDVAKFAELEQGERMYLDPWMDAIASWMDGPGAEVKEITVAQVWEFALGGTVKSITRSDQTRIGRILVGFGWYKYRPLRGGTRTKVYQRPAEKM